MAKNGRFFPLYRAWAREFLQQGYVVLVVDSAKSRGFGQTCSASEARKVMWRDRPKDAYAALRYLQAQPFVRPDRIALVGWSQGGGVVLLTISDKSIGRPAGLASDFAAAVAFYPGACAEKFQTQPLPMFRRRAGPRMYPCSCCSAKTMSGPNLGHARRSYRLPKRAAMRSN
ncbi:dienelactone hydrolase [Bradyrhizobium algeriense]|uniref:Dienelactone hydrolase n=1 Tax=Bradyrhizobium algeriense TaxID=634784 RepID=A0ABU8B2Z1_9BRAD